MITAKNVLFRPILESSNGIHLTTYLDNRNGLLGLKAQLRKAIEDAKEWLHPAQTPEEMETFLEPLVQLLKDERVLQGIGGNIGVFRNHNFFRVLNIPIEVTYSCQVATTFHVKPILRWLQMDQDFLFLGIEKTTAYLYFGNQSSFRHVDSVPLSHSRAWMKQWLKEIRKDSRTKLFVAGPRQVEQLLKEKMELHEYEIIQGPLDFVKSNAADFCKIVRKTLELESKKRFQQVLVEYRFAEEANRARKNIFQISKAAVKGRIRKLIVADELNIFGKIDANSGGLLIHPADLDHEDDCILDDLAQIVLKKGGEVIIAKRDEIPKGRPILAILKDNGDAERKRNLIHEKEEYLYDSY